MSFKKIYNAKIEDFKILLEDTNEDIRKRMFDAFGIVDKDELKKRIEDALALDDDQSDDMLKQRIKDAIDNLDSEDELPDFDEIPDEMEDEDEEISTSSFDGWNIDPDNTDETETDIETVQSEDSENQDTEGEEEEEVDAEKLKDEITKVLKRDEPEESEIEDILDDADDQLDKEDKKLKMMIDRIDAIVVKLITKFQDLIYTKGREIYKEMKHKPLNAIIEKYFDGIVKLALDSDELTFTIFFKNDVYEAFMTRVEDYIVFSELEDE